MLPTESKEIDGITFTTTMLPPLKAYPLAPRVAQIAIPVLQKMAALNLSAKDIANLKEMDVMKFLPMIEPLLEALGKKENEDLPQKLLASTSADLVDDNGNTTRVALLTPEAINRAFSGRGKLMTMIKAMWFVAGVNFGDFFGGGRKSAPTKAPQETASA